MEIIHFKLWNSAESQMWYEMKLISSIMQYSNMMRK